MLTSELQTEVALHIHDISNATLTLSQILTFIQSAARDAIASGALLPVEDDESLTASTTTYTYNVPASFAYIRNLWLESGVGTGIYDDMIPHSHWDLRIDGGVPVIRFETTTHLINSRKIKIVGQKRPTVPSSGATTLDPGLESFLRERSKHYALSFLASGVSELAAVRREQALLSYQISERLILNPEFRVYPDSRLVLGR